MVLVVLIHLKVVAAARKALNNPAPDSGHSTGRKIELMSWMNWFSRLPLGPVSSVAAVSPVSFEISPSAA